MHVHIYVTHWPVVQSLDMQEVFGPMWISNLFKPTLSGSTFMHALSRLGICVLRSLLGSQQTATLDFCQDCCTATLADLGVLERLQMDLGRRILFGIGPP